MFVRIRASADEIGVQNACADLGGSNSGGLAFQEASIQGRYRVWSQYVFHQRDHIPRGILSGDIGRG
jgi:hypothetical protein